MNKLAKYQDLIYVSILTILASFHLLFALRTNLFFKVDDFFVLSYFKSHDVAEMIFDFISQGDLFGFRKVLGYLNLRVLFDLFRTNPTAFIINNHVIHTANLIFLYLVSKKLTKRPFVSFFVALIFNKYYLLYFSNVHEYLVTLFSLSSIYLYLKFPTKAYSLFVFVLALLTKEVAFAVPFFLLALALNRKADKGNLKQFFMVLFIYSAYQFIFFLKGSALPAGNESYFLTFRIENIVSNLIFFINPILIVLLIVGAFAVKKPKLLFLLSVAFLTIFPSLLLQNRHEIYYIYLPASYLLIYLALLLPKVTIKNFYVFIALILVFGGRSILPQIARQTYPDWNKISIENVVNKVEESLVEKPDKKEVDIKSINLERDAKIMLQTNTLDLFISKELADLYNFTFEEQKFVINVQKN